VFSANTVKKIEEKQTGCSIIVSLILVAAAYGENDVATRSSFLLPFFFLLCSPGLEYELQRATPLTAAPLVD
jgi:hypothetical protein